MNETSNNNKTAAFGNTMLPAVLDFGDYCTIEMKRHGAPNEFYTHKVIGRLRSNTWVDVPVQSPATEEVHDEMEDVIRCVCCGVCETQVLKFRMSDVRKHGR